MFQLLDRISYIEIFDILNENFIIYRSMYLLSFIW